MSLYVIDNLGNQVISNAGDEVITEMAWLAKPIPDEFQYQLLNVITAALPEGDFAYGRPSLKDPDLGPEGDFIYKKVK
jgi:hypothetical protein